MVNYHTSTLLESSEHVFELIRYNLFLAKVNAAPPYLWCRIAVEFLLTSILELVEKACK